MPVRVNGNLYQERSDGTIHGQFPLGDPGTPTEGDIDVPIGPALDYIPTGDSTYMFGKPLVAPNGDWLLIGTAGSAHVAADNRIVLLRSPVGPNQGESWTDPVDVFKDENPADTFDTSTRQFACYVDPLTKDIIVLCGVIKTQYNPFVEGYFRVHQLRSSDNGTTFTQTDITSQIPDAVTGNDKLLFHGSAVVTTHGTAICLYSADEVRIAYTTDGSYTYSNFVTVPDAPTDGPYGTATEPELCAITPDNLVLVCRHNQQAGSKAYMKSTNGGTTWSSRSAYTTVGESGCTVDQPVAMKLVGDYVYFAFTCRLPTGYLITNVVHKDTVWADPSELWNPTSENRQLAYRSNTLDSQNAEGNSQAYIDFGNCYLDLVENNPGEVLIAFFDHAPYPENPVHTVLLNFGTFPDVSDVIFETTFSNDASFNATGQQASWAAVEGNAPEGFNGALTEGASRVYGVAGEGVGGSVAMKFEWDPALGQPVAQLYKHLTGDNTVGHKELYIRYKVRLPNNIRIGELGIDDVPYWKWGRLWQNTRVSEVGATPGGGWTENRADSGYSVWNFGGTITWGIDAGITMASPDGPNLDQGSAGGGRYSNDYYIGVGDYSTHAGHFNAVGGGAWDFDPTTRSLINNTSQTWHTIEWRFKLATDGTSYDGVTQMWFDGVEQPAVDINPGGSATDVGATLGPNENPTPPIAPSNGYNMFVMFDNMSSFNREWDEPGVDNGIFVNDVVISTSRIGHDYEANDYVA